MDPGSIVQVHTYNGVNYEGHGKIYHSEFTYSVCEYSILIV